MELIADQSTHAAKGDDALASVQDFMRAHAEHIEAMCAAYYQLTKIDPREAVLVSRTDMTPTGPLMLHEIVTKEEARRRYGFPDGKREG